MFVPTFFGNYLRFQELNLFILFLFGTGYREEPERRPSPPEESEEWDYEEGHSPTTHTKEQAPPSR